MQVKTALLQSHGGGGQAIERAAFGSTKPDFFPTAIDRRKIGGTPDPRNRT